MLDIIHDNAQLLTELIKILNFFKIKNKLFEVITDNTNNNNILKKEFKKTIYWRDFRWEKKKNFITCLTHVINLMMKTFIEVIDFQVINNDFIIFLNDDQTENVKRSMSLLNVV